MNWQAVSFDWNQVRAFLATADAGTLSGAARALGLTQPTLGRQVAALEAHLGVTLFDRAGRGLILTSPGTELLDHVRAMGEAATRLSLAAAGQSQAVEGRVRITASEIYSAYMLPPVVRRLRETHPGIVVEIVATNALSDLRSREADIAIRNAEPTNPDLIARRMRDDEGALYAADALVERFGPFATAADLAGAPFVGFGDTAQFLTALGKRGVPVTERDIVADTASHLTHWALARAGVGVGLAASRVGDTEPGMRPVPDTALRFRFPVWLVAPRELRTSRRIRVVFDHLAESLGRPASPAPQTA